MLLEFTIDVVPLAIMGCCFGLFVLVDPFDPAPAVTPIPLTIVGTTVVGLAVRTYSGTVVSRSERNTEATPESSGGRGGDELSHAGRNRDRPEKLRVLPENSTFLLPGIESVLSHACGVFRREHNLSYRVGPTVTHGS